MSNGLAVSSARGILLITFIVLLSACASIPMSTMWKLRSFSGNDLKTLNPADIRVVVKVPDVLKFEPDQTNLDLTLTPEDTKQKVLHEQGKLVLVKQGRFVPADVPVAEPGETLYLMKLDPGGLESFRAFQQRLDPDVEQHYKAANFSANIRFANEAAVNNAGFQITVWLRLQRDQGYFALLKDAPLKFSQDTSKHDGTPASR